jgi:two-component system chemotaxis response regulator CheY
MPVMEGLEALKHIIQQDPDEKVMMCSLMGQYSMVVQAIEEGAKDYIVKPFQADRVLATVKRVLG